MVRRNQWRNLLPFFIILVLAVSILSILIVNHARDRQATILQDQLENTAQLIEAQTRSFYGTPDEESLLSTYAEQNSTALNIHITFLDMSGNLLGSSLPQEQLPGDPLSLPGVTEALSESQASLLTVEDAVFTKIIQDENHQNLRILHLQAPLNEDGLDILHIFWLTMGVIVVSLVGMWILAAIIKDKSLDPVDKLTIAAQELRHGNFNHLEFPSNAGDLQDLNLALQDMAHNLGGQIETLGVERGMLSAVLNQMTDGVIITDSDGRVRLLNPAAERIFQFTQSEGLDRSIVEVLRYHQLVDLWRKAKDGDRQSTMIEIGPQHLFLQVVGIPLKTTLPGSTMLLIQDLTQLRRLETVRRDFISNVSHELRTPLASLKALAETLQEGALDDPPAARRFILRMETEIDNLTQLVNELLELSRIESGKVPLSFHRIQPCELLKPAFERMALQAERADLKLLLNCQPDLPAVFADPDRITQVLINLVHNAIKFTPSEGEISLNAYQDGEQIIFFVKDSGVGIARKDLGRIFERFYKADRARTSGGTGLGLSISRHMIESHGGYIWAESEEGVGSTFYFSLPIA
jgi:two-component system phosphate regulon sensor histidine kinase PhoR